MPHTLHFIPDHGFAISQVRHFSAALARAEQAHEEGKISDAKLIQIRMAREAALLSLELAPKPKTN